MRDFSRTKFLFFSFVKFALRVQCGCVERIEIRWPFFGSSSVLVSVSKIQESSIAKRVQYS